jgi:molybdopterin converting factor small subunit
MKVSIITEGGRVEFENDTVENVRALVEAVGPSLNIGTGANIAVNGEPADLDTPLADGDEVTTTKPAGSKGN